MLLWAFLAAVRVSVNLYLDPDISSGCADYGMYCGSYISLLRDRSVTTLLYDRSPFLYFYQSDMGIGYFFLIYRLSGGNIHRYNSFGEVFDT